LVKVDYKYGKGLAIVPNRGEGGNRSHVLSSIYIIV